MNLARSARLAGIAGTLAILAASGAQAAEGSCLASYPHSIAPTGGFYSHDNFVSYSSRPALGGQSFHFGTWVAGQEPPLPFHYNGYWFNASQLNINRFQGQQTYPTAYRPNFTSSTRENVWRVSAGENSHGYTTSALRNWNGATPAYGGNNYNGANYYTTAELNLGLAPGTYIHTKMVDYIAGQRWVTPDPQQHAARYVMRTAYPAVLKHFNYTYSPDVNVSDAQVRADAIANAAMLTNGTKSRLQQYIANGSVGRGYVDLNPGVMIDSESLAFIGPQWWRVSNGRVQEDCGLFAEIVKHPRIEGVYYLKYFIRTARIYGLAPFQIDQVTATFIAYAPYAIGPMYTAPTIRNDTVTTRWDQAINIQPLSNDSAGSAPLSLKSASNPTRGSRSISGNTIRFTPQSGWVGTVTMSYVATDGTTDAGASITVNVVAPPNQAPSIRPDTAATNYRLPVTFNVLANDSDPDGRPQALRVSSVTTPSRGSMTWNANGTVTYTPQMGYIGPVTFSYTATDGEASGSATITVNVADGNRAPIAVNDNASTDNLSAHTVFVISNDTDEDGDVMQVTAVTQPSRGSVAINPGRHSVTYTPQAGVNGTFSFTYTLSDGKLTDTATVSVTVGNPVPPPSAWSGQPFDYRRYCNQTQEGQSRNSTYSSECWEYMQRYRGAN